jgi:hypothetical protein
LAGKERSFSEAAILLFAGARRTAEFDLDNALNEEQIILVKKIISQTILSQFLSVVIPVLINSLTP